VPSVLRRRADCLRVPGSQLLCTWQPRRVHTCRVSACRSTVKPYLGQRPAAGSGRAAGRPGGFVGRAAGAPRNTVALLYCPASHRRGAAPLPRLCTQRRLVSDPCCRASCGPKKADSQLSAQRMPHSRPGLRFTADLPLSCAIGHSRQSTWLHTLLPPQQTHLLTQVWPVPDMRM